MKSYKRYVKASKAIQINHGKEMYVFAENEVQLIEFETEYYYNIMLRDMPLEPATEAEYNAYEIPVIFPPDVDLDSLLRNIDEELDDENPPCDDGDHNPNRTQIDNTVYLIGSQKNIDDFKNDTETKEESDSADSDEIPPIIPTQEETPSPDESAKDTTASTEELVQEPNFDTKIEEETKPEGFICPVCNQVYSSQRGLNMHISRKHSIEK